MREISPEMPVKDTAIFPKKEIDTIAKSRDLSAKKETPIPPKKDSIKPKMPKPKPTEKSLEQSLTDMGLIDIQTIDASIKSDVKYSTTDNFMKADAYGELNKIFLQKEVAQMLAKAHVALKKAYPTYRFVVFDGARPFRVQQKMWEIRPSATTVPSSREPDL